MKKKKRFVPQFSRGSVGRYPPCGLIIHYNCNYTPEMVIVGQSDCGTFVNERIVGTLPAAVNQNLPALGLSVINLTALGPSILR